MAEFGVFHVLLVYRQHLHKDFFHFLAPSPQGGYTWREWTLRQKKSRNPETNWKLICLNSEFHFLYCVLCVCMVARGVASWLASGHVLMLAGLAQSHWSLTFVPLTLFLVTVYCTITNFEVLFFFSLILFLLFYLSLFFKEQMQCCSPLHPQLRFLLCF